MSLYTVDVYTTSKENEVENYFVALLSTIQSSSLSAFHLCICVCVCVLETVVRRLKDPSSIVTPTPSAPMDNGFVRRATSASMTSSGAMVSKTAPTTSKTVVGVL